MERCKEMKTANEEGGSAIWPTGRPVKTRYKGLLVPEDLAPFSLRALHLSFSLPAPPTLVSLPLVPPHSVFFD